MKTEDGQYSDYLENKYLPGRTLYLSRIFYPKLFRAFKTPDTIIDLGCGTGTFTFALATLLPPGTVIHAIDKDERSLSQIPDRYQDVTIRQGL